MTWDDGTAYLEELAPGIFAYVQPHGGWMVNNCGVVTDGAADALLVDTTSTERRTRALLAEVERVAGAPRLAVNTHHHPDHTYGNGFLPSTTTVIGHPDCRVGVLRAGTAATLELPADYGDLVIRPPDVTVVGELTVHLGDVVVELLPMGPAHTSHDIGVWLPEQRVMFAGDLAFTGGHPIFAEGSMLGFGRALDRMRELGTEVLVPGHGPVCRGEEAERMIGELESYVSFCSDVARSAYAEGLTPLEAAKKHADNPFSSWPESERLVANLHRAYQELTDYEPPFRLIIPNLMPEMVDLHGGPLTTDA